jgi:pantetheine-phosphate adenylyltransferase
VRDIILHGGDASMFLPKKLNMDEFRKDEDWKIAPGPKS